MLSIHRWLSMCNISCQEMTYLLLMLESINKYGLVGKWINLINEWCWYVLLATKRLLGINRY